MSTDFQLAENEQESNHVIAADETNETSNKPEKLGLHSLFHTGVLFVTIEVMCDYRHETLECFKYFLMQITK